MACEPSECTIEPKATLRVFPWLKQWLVTSCCQLLLKRDFETKERGPTTLDFTRTLHMCLFMQWMIARSTTHVRATRSLVNSARQVTKLLAKIDSQLKSVELLSGVELLFRGSVGITWTPRLPMWRPVPVSFEIFTRSRFFHLSLNQAFLFQSCPIE